MARGMLNIQRYGATPSLRTHSIQGAAGNSDGSMAENIVIGESAVEAQREALLLREQRPGERERVGDEEVGAAAGAREVFVALAQVRHEHLRAP